MQKITSIKNFLIAVCLVLIACSVFFPIATLSANAAVSYPLTPNGYFFLESPSSIFVSDGEILVADNSQFHVFDTAGEFKQSILSDGAKVVAKSGENYVRLLPASISWGDHTIPLSATDLSVCGNNAYAADGEKLFSVVISGYAEIDTHGVSASLVAAGKSSTFFVSKPDADCAIYRYLGGNTELVKKMKTPPSAIAVIDETMICYAVGADLYSYDMNNDIVAKMTGTTSDIVSISAYNGAVYMLTSYKEIISYNKTTEVLVSNLSAESGFFDTPTVITSRKGLICVIDSGNNRVAVISNDSYVGYISIDSPTDVAIGLDNNIYVSASHSVKVFSKDLEALVVDNTYSIPASKNEIISVAIDNSDSIAGNIFAVTDNGKITNISSGFSSGFLNVKKIRMSPSGELFALTNADEILRINKIDLIALGSSYPVSNATDFIVDAEENIFIAGSSGVTKYAPSGNTYSAAQTVQLPGQAHGVTISMVETRAFSFGDIIATDNAQNRIVKTGLAADMRKNTADANYFYLQTGGGARIQSDSIIRHTLLNNTEIYSKPIEMPALAKVAAGTNMIVIDSITYNAEGYWFVLCDMKYGEGIYGFINKDLLSDAREYSDSQAQECVFISATELYKFPSRHSTKVGSAVTGDRLPILSFVNPFYDAEGNEWCRIGVDGNEYYALRGSISIGGNEVISNNNMPIFNSYIKAQGDQKFVHTYDDENGKIVSDFNIEVGVKIEVVGTFNLAKDYTQIKYVITGDNGEFLVRTCYVATENVYFAETTIYQVIAFVVIALIIVLAVALFFVKRKRDNNIEKNS